jgi:hypothetical protein
MTKEIPLTRGMVALVDDADFDWLNQWKWCATAGGYAMRRINITRTIGEYIYMHRLIAGAGEGVYADHINHDTLDNRRCNLRIATPGESIRNTRARKNNLSVFKGVVRNRSSRWAARIQVDGAPIHLGYFLTQREAAHAYNEAAIQLHGEFACLNDLSILTDEQDVPLQPKRGLESQYRGIYKDKRRNHWVVEIMVNRSKTYVGSFATDVEAAHAYDAYITAHGLDRKINFP